MNPNQRLDSVSVVAIKKSSQGPKYGFFIYAAIALLAWWLPYVALAISVLIWIYWLYVSLSLKEVENL